MWPSALGSPLVRLHQHHAHPATSTPRSRSPPLQRLHRDCCSADGDKSGDRGENPRAGDAKTPAGALARHARCRGAESDRCERTCYRWATAGRSLVQRVPAPQPAPLRLLPPSSACARPSATRARCALHRKSSPCSTLPERPQTVRCPEQRGCSILATRPIASRRSASPCGARCGDRTHARTHARRAPRRSSGT